MNNFLIIGTLTGLIFSLFHAVYLSRLVADGGNSSAPGSVITAFNFALWTLVLWILMGGYLLGFWLIALAFYVVFKAFR